MFKYEGQIKQGTKVGQYENGNQRIFYSLDFQVLYLVFGTWYLVLGVLYLIFSIYHLSDPVSCVWYDSIGNFHSTAGEVQSKRDDNVGKYIYLPRRAT